MGNLTQRLITGTIFVCVLVGAIWFSVWTMAGLFLLIVILGLWEFYKLAEKAGAHPQKVYGLFLGIILFIGTFIAKAYFVYLNYLIFLIPLLILPFFFLPFFIELFRKKEKPFSNIGWTLLGVIYVAAPFTMLMGTFTPQVFFSDDSIPYSAITKYDYRPLLTFFVLIWTSDSMAYVCGRLFGKHKLFERISPKKTWEGFIGGFIFTLFAGGMIANWILYNPHYYSQEIKWIIISAIISVTGVLGDLTESLFKRSIDMKDSGTILPGHGGILDRFDAMLLATPFALSAYWICNIFFPGHYC